MGVTSRGFGKCSIDLPSQYVRVTTIKSWIQENAPEAQDSSCNSIKIATTTAPKTTISEERQLKDVLKVTLEGSPSKESGNVFINNRPFW